MRGLAERGYFLVCRALGRLLRSAKYSKARIVHHDGERHVRKHRAFYAPLLIWMGDALFKVLDTGVQILPQREWEKRERKIYGDLRRRSIRIDSDGTLVLPCLSGVTLAALLEDRVLQDPVRKRAIERAVLALVEFHQLGLTHADAMAENVLIDLDAGVAHWFDFETVHVENRSVAWRRADDLRALLVTCLIRTVPEKRAETLRCIIDVYADEEVTRVLAGRFSSVWQRPLMLHLAQAGLTFQSFREIAQLVEEWCRRVGTGQRPGSRSASSASAGC